MDAELYTAPDTRTENRRDVVYRRVKTQLLVGDFALNQRLGEERLAAALEVSRTPVREALQRLAAEGLVERHPEGGFRPAVPDVQRIRELYEVRRSLELSALRRPSEFGQVHDRSVLEPLRDDWRAMASTEPTPDPEFVLHDESFHLRLAEAAGNATLVDMLSQVNERIRVVRTTDFLTSTRITRTVAQHLGIAEALLSEDLRSAELRFVNHLSESMAVVEERVMRALARMATGPTPGGRPL
ncbi:MAG: GntR family transcriptional regulator [Acidobacteriota bacterium]|nr:GntR family transcriptional regulator [Acidobacteriota bacterium]